MEIEAWFIADKNLFQKINPILTFEYIQQQLGHDLKKKDPELEYDHPTIIIRSIYNLAGKTYKKNIGDCYKIADNIDFEYLYFDVKKENKIHSFFDFVDSLEDISD